MSDNWGSKPDPELQLRSFFARSNGIAVFAPTVARRRRHDVQLLPSSERCHGGRKAVASALAQG